jgi:hypothetical protein
MSVETSSRWVDVRFKENPKDGAKNTAQWSADVIAKEAKKLPEEMVLRLSYGLMGETSPRLTPMASDFAFEDASTIYRYDWTVGLTPVDPCYQWPWIQRIRETRALSIQLLLDMGESGLAYSEVAAMLLTLQPSKDTTSWLERNADKLGDSLAKLADIASPVSGKAAGILKVSSLMSNFISSDQSGVRNWFLYRFLDETRNCCAIEWNIHRTVLEQYGPMLRGSIVLAFHGTPKNSKPIHLILRPRLCFSSRWELEHLPPLGQLEAGGKVELTLNPVVGA